MNSAYELLTGTFGASLCWALWFYGFKQSRLDAFREDLFALRERLFKMALEKQLRFTDPAYVELRLILNAMIRFADRISPLTLLLSSRGREAGMGDYEPLRSWLIDVDRQPAEVQAQLQDIHLRMLLRCTRYLISGSVLLGIFSFVIFVCKRAQRIFDDVFSSSSIKKRRRALVDIAETLKVQSLETKAYEDRAFAENSEYQLV